jgi:hypothetical protein
LPTCRIVTYYEHAARFVKCLALLSVRFRLIEGKAEENLV